MCPALLGMDAVVWKGMVGTTLEKNEKCLPSETKGMANFVWTQANARTKHRCLHDSSCAGTCDRAQAPIADRVKRDALVLSAASPIGAHGGNLDKLEHSNHHPGSRCGWSKRQRGILPDSSHFAQILDTKCN